MSEAPALSTPSAQAQKKETQRGPPALPEPYPPLSQSPVPAPNSNKNRSLVCSHLFIVRCKLSRDTAQGRCAPRNSLAPRLPTTDGLVQSSDPALLAVLEDAAIDLP